MKNKHIVLLILPLFVFSGCESSSILMVPDAEQTLPRLHFVEENNIKEHHNPESASKHVNVLVTFNLQTIGDELNVLPVIAIMP
jgi:hypothetical protein